MWSSLSGYAFQRAGHNSVIAALLQRNESNFSSSLFFFFYTHVSLLCARSFFPNSLWSSCLFPLKIDAASLWAELWKYWWLYVIPANVNVSFNCLVLWVKRAKRKGFGKEKKRQLLSPTCRINKLSFCILNTGNGDWSLKARLSPHF